MEKRGLNEVSIFLYTFDKEMAPKDKVKFLRDFFGYKLSKGEKEYSYKGQLDLLNGEKISKNTFIIPNKHSEKVEKYLKSKGVNFFVK